MWPPVTWPEQVFGLDLLDNILATSEFYAPLTHSLALTRGTGSATYTRATTAWEFDNEGKLITVPTGIPRFGGARFDGTNTWYNTDSGGAAISAASLLGYHAEGARTNNLLYSRDLVSGYKNSVWKPGVTGSELVTNGEFNTDAASWTPYGTSLPTLSAPSGALIVTNTGSSAGRGATQSISTTSGLTYTVTFKYVSSTGTVATRLRIGVFAGDSSVGSFIPSAGVTHSVTFIATAATTYISLADQGTDAASTLTWDDVSVKQSTVAVSLTATGIDNAANSASTITAGADNATILQTLTLASAARSSSAYIKRRTGTGTISFTRNGGTTWTDITSQINSSTWTRIKIENSSVLNPSIGFLIATSGDAIDVDVVQDEAGAFASSPIITTTAAVTRNADALSYASGNLNNSVGAILVTAQTNSTAGAGAVNFVDVTGAALFLQSADARTTVKSYDGTTLVQKTGLGDLLTGQRKLACAWGGTAQTVTGSGGAVVSGSFDGAWGTTTAPIIATSGALYGYIKQTHIWQSALTDAQLQQVTT